jgi:hypothetical protein
MYNKYRKGIPKYMGMGKRFLLSLPSLKTRVSINHFFKISSSSYNLEVSISLLIKAFNLSLI